MNLVQYVRVKIDLSRLDLIKIITVFSIIYLAYFISKTFTGVLKTTLQTGILFSVFANSIMLCNATYSK